MRRWVCLLAALCLLAGVALSARLLESVSVDFTPGDGHDIFTPAPDKAQPLAASNGQPTDRSHDRPSPSKQQPAGLEKFEDWNAKKFLSGFAVLFAPYGILTEYGGWNPEAALAEVGSDDSPPQLLQRPPPAG
jgi:hypothetical protein